MLSGGCQFFCISGLTQIRLHFHNFFRIFKDVPFIPASEGKFFLFPANVGKCVSPGKEYQHCSRLCKIDLIKHTTQTPELQTQNSLPKIVRFRCIIHDIIIVLGFRSICSHLETCRSMSSVG